ncbi:MAG: 16S rRNA (adenine(1518)-N(6)/adenine(1519)-N(6))-dimethyltransferase RsmA [Candidatus Asgardarchaeum sp.]
MTMADNLLKNLLYLKRKYNIVFKKKLSQHFLIDYKVLEKIIDFANLNKDDIILEIGPGLGFLTRLIIPKVKKVIAVEIDKVFSEILKCEVNTKKLEVIEANILEINYFSVNKIISNVPYSISSKLFLKLLSFDFDYAILMFQKDFVDKIFANPGNKNYGKISALSQLFYNISLLEIVPPDAFYPKPKVYSAIIKLCKKKERLYLTPYIISFWNFLSIFFSRPHRINRATFKGWVKQKYVSQKQYSYLKEKFPEVFQKRAINTTPEEILRIYNLLFPVLSYEEKYNQEGN